MWDRVDRLLAMIDRAVIGYGPFFDVRLVVFPEFAHAAPIYETADELLDRLAVPVPNDQTDRYQRKARERGVYIQTGTFLESDPRWPGVVFNTTCLIGPDGLLYITTGDNHNYLVPQSPTLLGGKVLRVTTSGAAAPGNNAPAGFDARIFTYGHRNPQGIAFRPGTGEPFTSEHGPNHSDEVTKLERDFASMFGTNPNHANAFGKCVSRRAHGEDLSAAAGGGDQQGEEPCEASEPTTSEDPGAESEGSDDEATDTEECESDDSDSEEPADDEQGQGDDEQGEDDQGQVEDEASGELDSSELARALRFLRL